MRSHTIENLVYLIQSKLPDCEPIRDKWQNIRSTSKDQSFYGPDGTYYDGWSGRAIVYTFNVKLNDTKIRVMMKMGKPNNQKYWVYFVEAAVSREHTHFYEFDDLINDPTKLNLFCHELEHLAVSKDELFRNMPYRDVAKTLKMEKTNTESPNHVFTALFSKDKMAFGDSFPYRDIFTPLPKDKKAMILKALRKAGAENNIRAIWEYKSDPNLLLINTPGFHFLTTVDKLVNDIEKLF